MELIYGISTVHRERDDYLNDTLDSVLATINNQTGVVVLIADLQYDFQVKRRLQLKERYNQAIGQGRMELMNGFK